MHRHGVPLDHRHREYHSREAQSSAQSLVAPCKGKKRGIVSAFLCFVFSGMQQYFASGSTTLLLFSLQLAMKSLKKGVIFHKWLKKDTSWLLGKKGKGKKEHHA
jgi:hypothetical protein